MLHAALLIAVEDLITGNGVFSNVFPKYLTHAEHLKKIGPQCVRVWDFSQLNVDE